MASRTTRLRKPQLAQQPDSQSRAKWTASLTKTLADLMVDQIHKGEEKKIRINKAKFDKNPNPGETKPQFLRFMKFSPSPKMASRTTRLRKPQLAQQPDSQSRAKWTASLTKTLADLMVDQIHKGNKSNKSFSKKGWKFICDNFRIQTGYWWDNEQLKSRYVALRKQYINVTLLLDHPDFKWDETTGAITATDEAWDRYIKEHPDAEMLRIMGCPIYNQLRTIFAEPGTCGKQNGSTKDNEGSSCSFPSPGHPTVKLEELSPSESEKYADLASRKRGRKGIEDAIARGIVEMAAATKLRAEAMKKFNSKFSITDCVRALDELQGVNDQVYLAALDLFSNRNARETFLTLKVEKRLMWLQRKCLTCALP